MKSIAGWCVADFVHDDDSLTDRAVKTSPEQAILHLKRGAKSADSFDIVHPLSMMSYPGSITTQTWEYLVRKDGKVTRSEDFAETDERDPTVTVIEFGSGDTATVVYSIKGTGTTNEMRVDLALGGKSKALLLPYLKNDPYVRDALPRTDSADRMPKPRFHHGMLSYACNAFDLITKDYETITGRVAKVMFFGHSLGAACAMMCAHMFRAKTLKSEVEPIVGLFNGLTTIYTSRREDEPATVKDEESNPPEVVLANFIEAYIGEDPEDEGYEAPTEEEVREATMSFNETLRSTKMGAEVPYEGERFPSALEYVENKDVAPDTKDPSWLTPADRKYEDVNIFCGTLSAPNYVSRCCNMALHGDDMDDSFRAVNYMNFGDGVINNTIARASKVKYPTTVTAGYPSISSAVTHGVTRWGFMDPHNLYDSLNPLTDLRRAMFMHGKWVMPDSDGQLTLYYFKDTDLNGTDAIPGGVGFMRPLANALRHLQAIVVPEYLKRLRNDRTFAAKKELIDTIIREGYQRAE